MKIYHFAFLLLFPLSLYAQICEGNLGENIFEAGDFGSGVPNVLPNNPDIAPGYTYTTNVPPQDGFYTITNNSGEWTNGFGTWLDIPDNSSDPDGYFMVVNASFAPGLFYEQEVDGLCENTFYAFSTDIINMIRQGEGGHIAPNISFLIDGQEQYNTGNVPQNNAWITFGFSFTTAPGQTAVTLALRNNAPGGFGNDVGLDNIEFRACGPLAQILPETVERICEDGQFTDLTATIDGDQYPTPALLWQRSFDAGVTWVDLTGETNLTYTHTELTSGFYYYRYLLANGAENLQSAKCRVVSNVKIVEVVPKRWMVTDSICDGLVYNTGNSSYVQSGVYIDTLLSSLGCDSIVTLDLFFTPDPGLALDLVITPPNCPGDFGNILIDNVENGDAPYRYFIDDSLHFSNQLFQNLVPGTYQITAADRFGCTVTTDATVSEAPIFALDLGPDQRVLLGESVSFTSAATQEVAQFNWTPALPNCPPDCTGFEITPASSQTYRLDAVSNRGCVASDSVFIDVQLVRQLYIPNAFSPNFDGINDVFQPFANVPNVQEIKGMQIFNRWGALVFSSRNVDPNISADAWDGTFKNRPVDPGVYAYFIEAVYLDGFLGEYRGSITVLP